MTPKPNQSQDSVLRLNATTVICFVVIAFVVAGLASRMEILGRIDSYVNRLETVKRKAETQHEELSRLKAETAQTIGDLPQQQATIRAQFAELEKSIAPIREQLEDLEVESMTQKIENDRQLARAVQLRNLGHDTIDIIERTADECSALQDQTRDIKTGPIGKQIAADETLLNLYAVVAQPNVNTDQLAKWRNQVELRTRTVDSIDDETRAKLLVETNAIRELEEIREQAVEANKQLCHKQTTLDEIIARAKQTQVTDDAVSLTVALEQRKQRHAFNVESAAFERAQETARQQAVQLADARAETVQRRTQASLAFESRLQELVDQMSQGDQQTLADAAAKIRQESENRHALAMADLKRKRKESAYQAALPEIHEYLVPFVSNGNTQPRPRHVQYETASTTGPVALSKLKSHGALDNSPRGLFVLHALGADSSNDRPSGRFPPYYGGSSVQPRQVPFFRKVQQLLREHGELMVKNGLLAE